jgi:hypothetical protein
MTEPRNDDRSQARREAAALLNVDIDHMSPADGLRIDMVSALRLVIDHEQASVLSGGSADLGKLNVAVQSLIALLPGRELPAPESQREDPRETMWRIYSQMRKNGELNLREDTQVEALQAELASRDAEIARLKQLAGGRAPFLPDVIDPADVVPPSEIGHAIVGKVAGPDDPKPPVTIEAKAVKRPKPPAAPVTPAYDYNVEQGWRDHVLPDGTITPTPMSRTKYWGPVG